MHRSEHTRSGARRQTAAQKEAQDLKRTKERTIGYIIEKVSQWRKLYNGYMDENHQQKRMSLEEAAQQVSVSKKSLDDYLSQLRQGRTYGFDFNENKDSRVGVLRQFVKERAAQAPVQSKEHQFFAEMGQKKARR